ncbi:MAG TPA: hypothetical protein P5081_17950 [Phycisphaerae bacterium]|mgnify:CR=1 FL=1|nr:hypothetical protein [Phycisphaerae bacterium]HRW54756.1 hypothetical protein [Phycisphaerae bacterium]
MSSSHTRILTIVFLGGLSLTAIAHANPRWRVAVSDINATDAGEFTLGNPAQPGVDVESFGVINTPAGTFPFNGESFDLAPNVLIPAGAFDWGALVEAFAAPAGGNDVSGAAAFVIDGDETTVLRTRWTLGSTADIPGPIPPAIVLNALSIVRANARVRLVDLVPDAAYRVTWDWETTGDAATSTVSCTSGAFVELHVLMDGQPINGSADPLTTGLAFDSAMQADHFEDAGLNSLDFTATPGFTCDRELTIVLDASAHVVGGAGGPDTAGLANASSFGELRLSVEKLTTSPLENPGDLNCDQRVDSLDIEPFLTLVFSEQEYRNRYPCCPIENGDFDGDGAVTIDDVALFAASLVNR